jgi:sulfur carrier protein
MKLTINGQEKDLADGTSLLTVLREFDLVERPVLVEINGVALRRREHAARMLADGDRIEIIEIAAGG